MAPAPTFGSLPFSICLFCLATLVQGYTKFETTCKRPENPTSFVSSPDSRGTLDILWSSIFMIVACTWTIQHLNIPEERGGRDPGFRGDLKWRLKGIWQTTKWMLVTVIAPEFILGKAWADLADAKVDLDEFKKFAKLDNVPWTLTHSMLANMGGFVIRSNVERLRSQTSDRATETSNPEEIEEVEEMQQEGLIQDTHLDDLYSSYKVPRTNHFEYNNPLYLGAPDILLLRKSGLLPRLPHITVEEINDKSKSDAMVRAISIVQFTWTII